ncbi:MAG: hypothetical protein J1G38_04930 [Clostridiales bacterium]|nr:hypothetical protein [Clostridiales bacterium]
MKRRLLIAVMALVMSISAFAFVSCDDGETGGDEKLTHIAKVDATCLSEGVKEHWKKGDKYYGDKDGKTEVSYDELIIGKIPHTVGKMTHDDDGHWHLCAYTKEGEHDYKDADGKSDKEDHTLGELKIDDPATEEHDGVGHKDCVNPDCEYSENDIPVKWEGEQKPELTHELEQDSTCVSEGHREYWTDGKGNYYEDKGGEKATTLEQLVIAKKPHTVGDMTFDGQGHWHLCGNEFDGVQPHAYLDADGKGDKTGHTLGDWVYDKQPTDEIDGERHKECSGCDYETEKETAPATSKVVEHGVKDKTCTEDGVKQTYWEKGGKYYSDASCTEEFEITEEELEADYIDKATGHEWDATHDETDHYEECSVCQETQNRTENVWQVAHDETGHYEKCSECDETRGRVEGVWTAGHDEHNHYEECSECEEQRNENPHDYTDTVIEPTCKEGGKTTHECECGYSYDSDETAALDHDYSVSVFVPVEEATRGGWFYRGCSMCGESNGELLFPGFPNDAYADRKVTINGVEYGAYGIYYIPELMDKGVAFDAVADGGLFIVDLSKFDSIDSIVTDGTPTLLLVNGDISANSISFGSSGYIRGNGTLTLSSLSTPGWEHSYSIEANVVINSTGDGPLLKNNTRIENGSLTIIRLGDMGGSGINLEAGKEIYVGNGGSLVIKNFTNGIFGNNSKLTVDGGFVAVDVGQNALAGVNIDALSGNVYVRSQWSNTVTNGWEGESVVLTMNIYEGATVTVMSSADAGAIYNTNINIEGGNLYVKAMWAIQKCSLSFVSGKATIIAANYQNAAAFRDMVDISVSADFDLGVKGFAILVFEGYQSINVEGYITTSEIRDYTYQDGSKADDFEPYCKEGAVTPEDIQFPEEV